MALDPNDREGRYKSFHLRLFWILRYVLDRRPVVKVSLFSASVTRLAVTDLRPGFAHI